MPEPPSPVKKTTIHSFLQDRSQMRVSEEATNLLVGFLTTTAENVASKATETASLDDRTTILTRDIQSAWDILLQDSGASLLTPVAIHASIDTASNEGLGELIQLLRADL